MSRPAICRCPSCEGRAPDDDCDDNDARDAAKRRQDYLDDLADARADRARDERGLR